VATCKKGDAFRSQSDMVQPRCDGGRYVLSASKAGVLRVPIGWPNRFLIVIYCTWVILVAWHAIRLRARDRDGQGCPDDLPADGTARHRSDWQRGTGLHMNMAAASASTAGQPLAIPIEDRLRELIPQVLATVVRRFHDFLGAEDAVQEAALAAAMQWPRDGMPENPHAWLTQVAFLSMADQVRSDSTRRRHESGLVLRAAHWSESRHDAPAPQADDTLVLLFVCCHPALSTSSAIALTLRAVGGLTTAEIAKAFFVPEATMAERISRAKQSRTDNRLATVAELQGPRLGRDSQPSSAFR
jgi:DNA-directed RNA polymerase specialized sigma24 family protein